MGTFKRHNKKHVLGEKLYHTYPGIETRVVLEGVHFRTNKSVLRLAAVLSKPMRRELVEEQTHTEIVFLHNSNVFKRPVQMLLYLFDLACVKTTVFSVG